MSESQQSDALKKLVWFIIALAILGTVVAMIHYFAVDLPLQQATLHAPHNWFFPGSPDGNE
jgi:ABC-type antimicrobial peptide transport system permease subunit